MSVLTDHKKSLFITTELNKKGKAFRIVEVSINDMKIKEEREFDFPQVDGQKPIFDRVLFFGGRILACATTFSKEEELVRSWAFWCSVDSGITAGPILLSEHPSSRRADDNMFGYVLNTDSTMLLVYPKENHAVKNTRRPSFRLLDSHLETIWEKNIDFPATADMLVSKEFSVDQNGQLFLLSGYTKQLKGRKETLPLQTKGFSIATYNPDENKIKEFEVELDGKWLHSTEYVLSDSGDFIIAGFFSNDRYFSIAGTYYFKIDGNTKQIVAKSLNPFSNEFLSEFSKNRNGESPTELEDVYLDNLFLTPNGETVLTAENYLFSLQYRTDITTGRQQVMYYYYYNDIVSVRLDREGKEKWVRRTPKFQETVNDNGENSSYATIVSDNNLYFIFNDDQANSERWTADNSASLKVYSGNRRNVVASATILTDGIQSRNNPQGTEEGIQLNPKVSVRVGNYLFVMAQSRKEKRFARIQF